MRQTCMKLCAMEVIELIWCPSIGSEARELRPCPVNNGFYVTPTALYRTHREVR